jgi:diguanylate cyclase (GGDEF)-like protein
MEVSVVSGQQQRWFRVIGQPTHEEKGWSVLGATQDVTEKKERLSMIEHQARHDQLTGLPNRRHFNEALNRVIQKFPGEDSTLAILFIDLDNFKPVNDNLGHSAGDELLRMVSQRIRKCLRDTDMVSRHSGDEFTVFICIDNGQIEPQTVAQRIVDALNKPYIIDQQQVHIGCFQRMGQQRKP